VLRPWQWLGVGELDPGSGAEYRVRRVQRDRWRVRNAPTTHGGGECARADDAESSDDEDDDEDEEVADADAESTLPVGSKRKRPPGDSDGEEEDDSVSGDEGEDEDEDSPDVPFTLTLETALTSPIYPAPRSAGAGPDGRLCVLCPGKVLKHARMVEVHLSSSVSWLGRLHWGSLSV
jgi:hypothetical protein